MEFEIKKMEVELALMLDTMEHYNSLTREVEMKLDMGIIDKEYALAYSQVLRRTVNDMMDRAWKLRYDISELDFQIRKGIKK